MKIKAKRYITLMELLMVIVIMSIVSGVVGISIVYAKKDQHFRTEVSIVMDKIRLAQNLMLILGKDVFVRFKTDPDGQGINVSLDFDEILTKGWSKELKKDANLKEIRSINFNDNLNTGTSQNQSKRGELELKFLSNGAVMSSGILRLAVAENDNDAGSLVRYICLPGYPQAIYPAAENPEALKCKLGPSGETDLDRRLTQYTIEEIPVYQKVPDQAQSNQPAGPTGPAGAGAQGGGGKGAPKKP